MIPSESRQMERCHHFAIDLNAVLHVLRAPMAPHLPSYCEVVACEESSHLRLANEIIP